MTCRSARQRTQQSRRAWLSQLSSEGGSAGTIRMAGLSGLLRWAAAAIMILPLMATKTLAQGTASTYTVLHNFTGGSDGSLPYAGLVRDDAGNLYGTTYSGGTFVYGVVFKLEPSGNETVLHAFTGGADGGLPIAGLIRDGGGNLYGTTSYGGTYGNGVVFKLDPSGKETALYAFTGGSDGGNPSAGLIQDSAGNLYGTTTYGGSTGNSCPHSAPGCGVVFKLDPSGNETVLYTFTGGSDGWDPIAGLIRDGAGNLYGTTYNGGKATGFCLYGCGVVFKLDPSGKETVLHTFTGGADGWAPSAGLIRDGAGNLYGTTLNGGNLSYCSGYGCGVVFILDPPGNETVLHSFTGGADGGNPSGDLILDAGGRLAGTTLIGGSDIGLCSNNGCGVVFEVDQKGNETMLHQFCSQPSCEDGLEPHAGLLLDRAGNAYGTTYSGGAYNEGVVFKLSPP